MTTKNQVNGKLLYTNGFINPSLSLAELLQFDVESKRLAIDRIQVWGRHSPYNNDIDRDLFEPLTDYYSYDQLNSLTTEDQIDEALKTVFTRLVEHHQQMIIKTDAHHYELGVQIYVASKQLKFSGELYLTKGQLLGFIAVRHHSNDFDVTKVSRAINFLHNSAPRKNYGINNSNTGQIMHKWSMESDYIYMRFEYCHEQQLKAIQLWFEQVKHVQQSSNAYTFRLQIDALPDGAFNIRLVMWWQ
ncbi:hypothetical protein [Niastella sp. OAS944]|uniref:hypothetical protein n=1 Tax=Niastella sp. OAS944 TaxID=2664089 RepID=UPI0034941440|nr:hypothetical protein [Chitinophagaceae bacterium OAS944]